jgi:hypothetical protein
MAVGGMNVAAISSHPVRRNVKQQEEEEAHYHWQGRIFITAK